MLASMIAISRFAVAVAGAIYVILGHQEKCYPVSNKIEMEEGSTKKDCKKLFSLFGFLGGFPC